MDDISVIEINEINVDKIDKIDKIDVDKIDFDNIDVDKNDVDKIFTFDDIGDEPHNGKPITIIEISPNENYLITYSEEDRSVAGWNVEDMDKVQLKFHQTVRINEDKEDDEFNSYEIKSLCVSDDKKLAYVYPHKKFGRCSVIDMNNEKKIALNLNAKNAYYCTFNLKGEFILCSFYCFHSDLGFHDIIWIYSTQTKNNKWECKRFYRIPEGYELIRISKYDNVYLVSNDYIYEWNINTEKSVKLFGNNKDKNKFETKIIGIFSNEKFTSLKINDKIIVYSIEYELGIPIASLDIDDDIQLYNFMNHTGLFLLPLLFYYTPDKGIHNSIKYCWNNKYKNRLVNPTDELNDEQTKVVFGILNGRVWKSRLMSKTNLSSENSDELNKEDSKIIECDEINKKTYNYLIIHSYMDAVSTLFQKATTSDGGSKEEVLTKNLIQWKIYVDNDKIRLGVFKKINTEWESICTRTEIYPYKYKYPGFEHKFIASSLFNNNGIVMLTTFGILIYTFSENNKSIFLNYFYFMKFDLIGYKYNTITHIKKLQHYKRIFSSTLPLPNYDSFRLDGWVSENIS
ncbi:hypothetical protein RhiirA5_429594 [Rhizophagus irregularis]|uniref:Uncharacterized protein n=1 Tax=Rhizophagus irregularis TaxID=588596 RepID=A0A2N0NY49_9GLOM|nr:hypothetical protein RhiirA5_429594 [Rhizophagus irregularis]